MAIKPIHKPIICTFVSFSLKKTKEITSIEISGIPLIIGKKIAVFITPDKYKLRTLLIAIPNPLIKQQIT